MIFSIKIAPPPSQFKNLKPKKFSLLFLSHNCYISNMDNCVCIHVYNVRIMIWQYQNLFHINRRHIWLAHNQYNVFTASTTRWPIDDWGTSERLLTCFTNPSKLWLCNHLILHTVCVSLDHKSDHIMTNWPTYQHFTENFNALALSIFYNLSADQFRVGLTAPSSSSKPVPVVLLFLLVYYLRKHLSLSILDWF